MAIPDMIGIVVKDMVEALAFYRLIGLDIPEPGPGEDHVEVTANGYRIAWDTVTLIKGLMPDWTPPSGGHRMALAFKCANPADVDATYQRVIAAGYKSEVAPWDAFWGQRYATVIDPDGNKVDLFAPQ
jgi:uncharacterized glyoxalase superfamily protein PhnB